MAELDNLVVSSDDRPGTVIRYRQVDVLLTERPRRRS
jgi:hypothetical protein